MRGSSRAALWSDWSWSVAEISLGMVFLSCFPHPCSYKCIPQERYFHKDLPLVLLLGREPDQWQPVSEDVLGGSPCSGIVDQGCLRARGAYGPGVPTDQGCIPAGRWSPSIPGVLAQCNGWDFYFGEWAWSTSGRGCPYDISHIRETRNY